MRKLLDRKTAMAKVADVPCLTEAAWDRADTKQHRLAL